MPKILSMPKKHPDPADLYPIAVAAKECGVNRTTLQSAVDAGHCTAHQLGNGTPVVTLSDVRAWMATDRKPGRKPKAD
jgi:hypothetical protein